MQTERMLPLTTIFLSAGLWAALLGAVIGVERSLRKRPAGMRTSLFVSLGAALFTILSVEIAHSTGDTSTTRIASNIVQGIGFLGAGVILRECGSVVGLTTAATIFVEAAIGMAAGGGLYAVSGVRDSLIILFALGRPGLCRKSAQSEAALHAVSHFDEPRRRLVPDVHGRFRQAGHRARQFPGFHDRRKHLDPIRRRCQSSAAGEDLTAR